MKRRQQKKRTEEGRKNLEAEGNSDDGDTEHDPKADVNQANRKPDLFVLLFVCLFSGSLWKKTKTKQRKRQTAMTYREPEDVTQHAAALGLLVGHNTTAKMKQ